MPLPEGGTETPVDTTGLQEQIDTHQHILEDHDGAIRECQTRLSVLEPRVDTVEKAIATAPSGGAVVGKGYSYLDEFPGGTPADKLRAAFTVPRCVVPLPGTTIDAGTSPITWPAGAVLKGLAGAQTEFGHTWPVNVRHTGGSAVFTNGTKGTNYSGTKGWAAHDISFQGSASVRLFKANPMDASGNIMAYPIISGCSFNNFYTVIESPLLGARFDIPFFNNCYGPYMFMLSGSDNQLWTQGGKGDWNGPLDPTRRALIVLQSMQKSTIGAGLYLTGQPACALEISGGASNDTLDVFGLVAEGRNPGAPCAGAVVRVSGGCGVVFHGGGFNHAMANPGSTGRGDAGTIDVSGGSVVTMYSPRNRPANGVNAPFVANRGGTVKLFDPRRTDGQALTYSGAVTVY
jgi:hypothetical protein